MMKYEEKLNRMEEIIALIEGRDLSLEEAMKLYFEAQKLGEECRTIIAEAKQQVKTFQLSPSNPKGTTLDE